MIAGYDRTGRLRTLRPPSWAVRILPYRPLREPRTILVVHPWGVGDWIMAEPALRALRARYPAARIDAYFHQRGAAAFGEALGGLATIERRPPRLRDLARLVNDLRRRRYDLAVATTSYRPWRARLFLAAIRPRAAVGEARRSPIGLAGAVFGTWGLHQVDANLAIVEAAGAPPARPAERIPRILLTDAERAEARAALEARGLVPGRTAVVHAGGSARFPRKRWPLEHFRALVPRLRALGLVPAAIVGPDEPELRAPLEALVGAGRVVTDLPPRRLCALLAEAGQYIGTDSAIAHLAAATGVPCVVVIGPASAGRSAPAGLRTRFVVHGELACQPCFPALPAGCPAMTCVRDLGADVPLRALQGLLERPGPPFPLE